MSERRDSTCQKHDLPKSLQGTEDAEFVWSMIMDRFPNAAPLLCDMEAVIDRAEDLLQQLRTPSLEIERSTSFCTPNSENSAIMVTARESTMFTDNDIVEENEIEKSVAEIQVSQSSISEEDVEQNSQHSIFKKQDTNPLCDSLTIHCSSEEKLSIVEEPVSLNAKTDTEQLTKHARSLEGWSRVMDNVVQTWHLNNDQSRAETIDGVKKCVDNDKANHIEPNEKKTEHSSKSDYQKFCTIYHSQEKCPDVGDSVHLCDSKPNVKDQELKEEIKEESINFSLKGSGDENTPEQQTPLDILETYSKRCQVPLIYTNVTDVPHRHKSNVYVKRGSLGGFSATCRGQTEESVKNDLATKILQMIANHQIKDEKLTTLAHLSKEEMLNIFNWPNLNLGLDSPRETAQRKLYQLCLEKGEKLPKYCVDKVQSHQGVTYVATCTALGYTGEGRGFRECVAKKTAAHELYHHYCQETKTALKVYLS